MSREILNTANLAPYAAKAAQAVRFYEEDGGETRSPFQRDRDRVIHSSAFRRLQYKTQVFIYHEGDHFRTRLTHSLEVAQIARSIARALRLDEDLAEAISLSHDLGHTPFGHAGEEALNACMANYGGFDHNAQSLKIVSQLEKRYANFDGLNLTKDTLEGLVKHNGPLLDGAGVYIGGSKHGRAMPHAIVEFLGNHSLDLVLFPTLEAQVANLSDDIAYNTHDIDDGLRADIITLDDLRSIELTARLIKNVEERYGDIERPRLIHETMRRMIAWMIDDILAQMEMTVAELSPSEQIELRHSNVPVIGFSAELVKMLDELRHFLYTRMYQHELVRSKMERAQKLLGDLFDFYLETPSALPKGWQIEGQMAEGATIERQVCDFIAGMTDRFAMDEYRRIFDLTPIIR